MTTLLLQIIALVGAYLVGSVPTGFLIARLSGVSDIRRYGSGNIGATNVARVLGKKFFALILLLDAGKAYGYVALLASFGASKELLCLSALALLLGNSASLFLRFTGGKGVAVTLGCLLFLAPSTVLVALCVWLVILGLTRNVGLASVAAALGVIVMGIVVLYKQNDPVALTSIVMALWVVLLHSKNMSNLKSFCRR
jgi:glycerol-3-phosphate acyltransferase PlsY